MIRTLLVCLLAAFTLVGCKSENQDAGYKKEDFEKKPVPPGFGPGGAHAPSSPPPSATGQ